MVYLFENFPGHLTAGGKADTLARLYKKGYPVPAGFIILPAAFQGQELYPAAADQIRQYLAALSRNVQAPRFAVRSSAFSEDSGAASFAGELETFLNLAEPGEIIQAAGKVRASVYSPRVQAYSREKGFTTSQEVAVIVQLMVQADFSGVLFTVDPVTGHYSTMSGNYIPGLGEKLVSGEVNPLTFTLLRPAGKYTGPKEIQKPVRQLYKLAVRLEEELEFPQDIEWAVADKKLWLLQSRPISTLWAEDSHTGEINHSRRGFFLWTNANFQEAVPDVMTPATYSLMQIFQQESAIVKFPAFFPASGNICGRPYVNLTLLISFLAALKQDYSKQLHAAFFGNLPPDLEIPLIPIPGRLIRKILFFMLFKRNPLIKNMMKQLPAFLETTPAWCAATREQIAAASSLEQLARLWEEVIKPRFAQSSMMLRGTTMIFGKLESQLEHRLQPLLGAEDTSLLLSGFNDETRILPSMGPLVGPALVAKGKLSRGEYILRYAHRSPHEVELSIPGPEENTGWLDKLLAEYHTAGTDIESLLEKQRTRRAAVLAKLQTLRPRRSQGYSKKLAIAAEWAHRREATRSEWIRIIRMVRSLWLQAGVISGLGEDIFFLAIQELFGGALADPGLKARLTARKESYHRYCSLPPYPAVILGTFDPFRWAADPGRRSDFFQAGENAGSLMTGSSTVKGLAGSAGVAEGIVRVVPTPEEGHALVPGEILVTTTTNVGWTPLFPRCKAIITDVGAPLSHAAIIARELGIPAVVGCGNATMCLKTGDRVRVDGARGVVERLE